MLTGKISNVNMRKQSEKYRIKLHFQETHATHPCLYRTVKKKNSFFDGKI